MKTGTDNQLLVEQCLRKCDVAPDSARHWEEIFRPDFPFADQLIIAESVHVHVHVPSVNNFPHAWIAERGGLVENKQDGYVKFGFPGGIKIICSHIPVAQAERHSESSVAYLDHIGIDIRSESRDAYVTFQKIPALAAEAGYLFKRQGDGATPVKCCHMQVKEKYWVFPGKDVNYEFSFGALTIHPGGFGIDLRPANPFNQSGHASGCCEPDAAVDRNSVVGIHYVLKNARGEVLEDTMGKEAIHYLHGSGAILPGLETELVGLRAGDRRSFSVRESENAVEAFEFEVLIESVRPATALELSQKKPAVEMSQGHRDSDCCC